MQTILKYRKIVWIFILLLIFTGIFTYLQLPKREIPEINVNVATISTVYPGATPEEVERAITNPIEEELLNIDGIEDVNSASTTGFGTISATINGEAGANEVYSIIRQAVTDVARSFPEGALDPEVNTDVTTSPVATYHIKAETYEELYKLRESIEEWEQELTAISGVQGTLVKGLPEQQVTITLDQEQVQANRLSPFSIISAINNEITPSAIGTEERDQTIYQLTIDKFSTVDDLSSLIIGKSPSGDPLTLGDVGDVTTTLEEPEDLITIEGQSAISLTVLAEEGVNIAELQEKISGVVDDLQEDLPENITVDLFYTQSTIITQVFTNLLTSFAISFIAVIIIMILGLPLSAAILVALSIPISIVAGLIPLPYIGVDLNQISIIGMIIAIGILVDDAIVVNDNIQRRFQLGDGPLEGTIKGVREVAKSIITSTLMIIFSFAPLLLLSGANGSFIKALPSVLVFTILASTVMALTLIPTVQYARQKRQRKTNKKPGLLGGFFYWLETFYAEKILRNTTKRPWTVTIAGIVLCVALSLLVTRIPFEFFPAADREEVTISVQYPQGTTIEQTNENLQTMQQFLQDESDVITETAVYSGSGLPNIFGSGLMRSGENTGQLLVRIDRDETSASTFINQWEEPLREEFPEADISLETIVSGPPPSPPVQVKIQGSDMSTLIEQANDLKDELDQLDGTERVTINAGQGQPFIEYVPDRDLLAENGLSLDQVISQIQIANTGVPLGTLEVEGESLPLRMIVDDGDPEGVNLENLQVFSPETMQMFSLNDVIRTEETERVGVIPHLNGIRTITVDAYPQENVTGYADQAGELVDTFTDELPSGYQVVESGEASAESEFFAEVSKLFVIVLFLIYLTIAIQFNSLLMPLLITGTVFLAVTGAIIGLFLSGEPLSFLAVLGIVSLSGVVVRNSVILIEFIELNKAEYNSPVEAAIEAGRARIRPILLTSITSIAALLPIVFSGDVLFRPLAVSIVSGLLFSTILTLLLVPGFYIILNKTRSKEATK